MTRIVTANQTAYNTSAEAAGNGVTTVSKKWFSLQDNKLDGTFFPVDYGVSNLALGAEAPSPLITDGDTHHTPYYSLASGLRNVIVDLGVAKYIHQLKIWHYWSGGRSYYNTKTEVSVDGVNWETVFDSAVSGTYSETSQGHVIDITPQPVRYIRDWLNGSTSNSGNHWVEIQAFGVEQVGWWGTSISNSTGVLPQPSILTIEETRTVWSVQVFGDHLLNEFPVDFTVQLFNGANLLHTHQVVGNTAVHYLGQLPQAYNVTRMVFTFTRVNKPSRTVRIQDVLSNFEVLRSDSLRARASSDITALGIGVVSSDTLRTRVTESPQVINRLGSIDGLLMSGIEQSSVQARLARVDSLLARLAEEALVSCSIASSDALLLNVAEAIAVTNRLLSSDAIVNTLSENSTLFGLIPAADSLICVLNEDNALSVTFTATDSIPLATGTSVHTEASLTATDSLSIGTASANTLINSLNSNELLRLVTDYATSASALLTSVDSIRTKVDDASFFTQYEIWKNDTLSSSVIEDRSIQASLQSDDRLVTSLLEQNQIVVSFSGQDVLQVSSNLSENRQVAAYFTNSDQLSIRVTELNVLTNTFSTIDSITVNIGEQQGITNSFKAADNVLVASDESRGVTNRLLSQDSVTVKSNMTNDVTLEVGREEIIKLSLKERSYMENVYTAMDAATRQVFGKVEITYTDVFSDETITASASETGRYTYPEQLADNVTVSAYKWFSLHDNKLDGSYHPMPGEQEYSVGWWGDTLSDENGTFVVPPVVVIEFAPRSVSSLRLCGSAVLDCYPKEFTIRLLDASGQVLATRHVANNSVVDWQEQLAEAVLAVTKIEATVHRINKPASVVKLTEMYTAVKEIYGQDDIESINIIEETGYVTGGLPIGNISANEIDIVLQNRNRKFDLNNNQSSLHGLVKKNRRVKVWLGAEIGGNMEWHPMGTYWTALWDIPRNSLVATLTARDRLDLLRSTDFIVSAVYRDKTLYELFEIVLQDAGLSDDEYELDTGLHGVTVPYAWFDRMSHRSALQRLAGAAVIQVYCTKEGKVRVNIDADATETVMATFDDDTNVYDSKYPLAVGEQVNYVDVTALKVSPGATEQLFDSAVDLKVTPGESVTESYRFRQIPVLEIDTIEIDTVDLVVEYQLYAWGVDVTYTNNTEETVNLGYVSISGKTLKEDGRQSLVAKDDVSIKDDGKITVNITHDFIQSARYAQELAERILSTYRVGRYDVTLDNRGNIALRLGDRVNVKDSYSDIVEQYSVYRQQIQWAGYLSATTEAKKV